MKNIKEEKKLSDYLHLYMGCEMYIFPPDTYSNGWLTDKLKKMPELQAHYTLTVANFKKTVEDEYFPILRPLSDMTEEENDFRWNNFINIKEINQQVVAEEIRWLLSKHFDLFNLIPEGLAIDKTQNK